MKRREFLSLGFFLGPTLLLPSAAHATAPSLTELTYDAAGKVLSVKIRHWSLADSLHYIKFVDINVNGTLASSNQYSSQPGNEYTYTYNLDAKPGDVVEVTAKCNWWGSRTVAITIPGGAQTGSPEAPKAEPAAK